MDKKSTANLIMIWVVMLAFMYIMYTRGNKPAPAPVKPLTFAEVRHEEDVAGGDKNKLNQVLARYNDLAKADPETETAAQARLREAIIGETKMNSAARAVLDYKSLVQDFPPATSPTGREAEQRLFVLQEQIDTKNSHMIGYQAMDKLVALTGRNPLYSYAFALLLITIILKVVTTPVSKKQYKSMKEMQRIQPLLKDLQEKYKDDKAALGQKTMDLYKEHGVNPFASCLPLLIQLPVMFGVYFYVISVYQYQFAKGHFLWIGSRFAQNLPEFVHVAVLGRKFAIPLLGHSLAQPDLPLLLLYTASMVMSSKLNVVDPSQAEQQKMMTWGMPIMMLFVLMSFQSSLVLYWSLFNIFSTVQQYHIMKAHDNLPPLTPVTGGSNDSGTKKPGGGKKAIPSKISKKQTEK